MNVKVYQKKSKELKPLDEAFLMTFDIILSRRYNDLVRTGRTNGNWTSL
jgi:hypothetical protein